MCIGIFMAPVSQDVALFRSLLPPSPPPNTNSNRFPPIYIQHPTECPELPWGPLSALSISPCTYHISRDVCCVLCSVSLIRVPNTWKSVHSHQQRRKSEVVAIMCQFICTLSSNTYSIRHKLRISNDSLFIHVSRGFSMCLLPVTTHPPPPTEVDSRGS